VEGIREVWFAQSNPASAGRFQVANSFSLARRESAPLAADGSRPWGIAVDSNRHLWVADTERNVIYQLAPPYIYRLYFATVFRRDQD
ncbi:MAG TPA: hypothetical protein VNK95_05645, partial [Caldilineaceae bacterium]|nr:hypothetical protein [Caldilineaceae bacterium]